MLLMRSVKFLLCYCRDMAPRGYVQWHPGALYVVGAPDISGNARSCHKIPLFLVAPRRDR